jgi:uncharacterized protein (DUF3084 family)
MNGRLNVQMNPSRGIVYLEQTRNKQLMPINTRFMALNQQLETVRKELKQVTEERDILRKEVLDCVQIF